MKKKHKLKPEHGFGLSPDLQRCLAEYCTGRFKLTPQDVSRGWGGSSSGGRKKAAHSRSNSITASTISLVHKPTGVEVVGHVPPGHYSRQEMRRRCEEVAERLMPMLENWVKRYLKHLAARHYGPEPKKR